MRTLCAFFLGLLLLGESSAQEIPVAQRWTHGFWKARWIAHPKAGATRFGVYHFRKTIQLDRIPQRFVVHVSADNQYRLFVNGRSVSSGPARSDPAHWNFETVDLSPYLREGENLVSATVWNFAEFRAYAQTSFETAFILQGDDEAAAIVNTNQQWLVLQDSAYQPLPIDRARLRTYLAVASGEIMDGRRHPWDAHTAAAAPSGWMPAAVLWYPAKARSFGTDGNWQLVPRQIPPMEEKPQAFASERTGALARLSGKKIFGESFPLKIPARQRVTLLLDQGVLTNAYPTLHVSGGRDAEIQLTYAEALVDSQRVKGDRRVVQGKHILGISDRFIADGGPARHYQPLQYRTFRYVELTIDTRDQPLTLDSLGSIFTAYPFRENAVFRSDDPGLSAIWETGWRTARLCAMDTYMDCPYYEQLQYVGDTRIQALVSLYVSGDDRLMRKAIDDISHSFIPEGLTQSRYPSRDLQVIPTFSLWWVCMLHDYYRYRSDDAFLKGHLQGVEQVLRWYEDRLDAEAMLGPLQWWQFVDWSWPWVDSIRVGGVPPGASMGGSAIISLQYAYTLQRAAELMAHFGRTERAAHYRTQASRITGETYRRCYVQSKGLLADTPEKNSFSQHANILAILTGAVPPSEQPLLLERVMTDASLTQATYYFRFYLFEALRQTGMGNRFLQELKPWYDMLAIGLTTFAENPEPTRSDCHAWSASPLYAFLSLTAGIEPGGPGFSSVRIAPNPGHLRSMDVKVPLPRGIVQMQWKAQGKGHTALIELPAGVDGVYAWKGKTIPLKAGKNSISLD